MIDAALPHNQTKSPRWPLIVGRVAFVLYIVGCLSIAWSFQVVGRSTDDPFSIAFAGAAPIAYLLPGLVLVIRRKWHIVGVLLCLFGVGIAFTFAGDWGEVTLGGPWVTWVQDIYQGSLFWLPLLWLLVAFPNGLSERPPRQRRFGQVLIAIGCIAVLAEVFVTEVSGNGEDFLPNPTGLGVVPLPVAAMAYVLLFLAMILGLAGLIRRHRSAAPLVRRQYRWVLSALGFLMAALMIGLIGSAIGDDENGSQWIPILLAFLLLPISFMVAILKFRLYEIDRLISRTVTYSIVVLGLVLTYLGAVALFSQALPADSDLAVAAGTLASAAVFSPLRRRIHTSVDRRFNRTRFDAAREVEALSTRLRDITDPAQLSSDLLGVLARTLQPTSAGLWVNKA